MGLFGFKLIFYLLPINCSKEDKPNFVFLFDENFFVEFEHFQAGACICILHQNRKNVRDFLKKNFFLKSFLAPLFKFCIEDIKHFDDYLSNTPMVSCVCALQDMNKNLIA